VHKFFQFFLSLTNSLNVRYIIFGFVSAWFLPQQIELSKKKKRSKSRKSAGWSSIAQTCGFCTVSFLDSRNQAGRQRVQHAGRKTYALQKKKKESEIKPEKTQTSRRINKG
jgi:hypothetical protein